MTFHFLLFTITVSKRTYTEEQLQQMIHDDEIQAQLDQYKTKYWT
ncbi:YrzI family small protein [Halalkalibacter okhensis]|nr:YrzI family small protein [Halalkalibacter okhensis]